MTNLVNIIHPYSYKMRKTENDRFELVMGKIKEFKKRDEKVVDFVKTSLDLGVRILRHEYPPKGYVNFGLQYGAMMMCPVYGDLLFDQRIKEIITLANGEPILDAKPESMEDNLWNKFHKLFISNSKLKRLIGSPNQTFYIGGFFEACVRNIAHYQKKNYTLNNDVFIIEDLCALVNDKKTQEIRDDLEKNGIKIITYKEAMELIQK